MSVARPSIRIHCLASLFCYRLLFLGSHMNAARLCVALFALTLSGCAPQERYSADRLELDAAYERLASLERDSLEARLIRLEDALLLPRPRKDSGLFPVTLIYTMK